MLIRLGTLTTENINDRENLNSVNGTTSSIYKKMYDGIINPWPFPRRPFDDDNDSSISWPPRQKVSVLPEPAMRINLEETDDAYILSALLPGFDESEVKIHWEPERGLTIVAEKSEETEIDNGDYIRQEIKTGRIERSISLPGRIDFENSGAALVNGVLTIKMPKDQADRTKYIPINKG